MPVRLGPGLPIISSYIMIIERTDNGINVTVGNEIIFIPKVNPMFFEHGLYLRKQGISVRDSWPGLPKSTYETIYSVLEKEDNESD